MPVGDKQKLIVGIVADVLGERVSEPPQFPWLINRHTPQSLGKYFSVVDQLFIELGGDARSLAGKSARRLTPDAYFGGSHRFLFEFDEMQHFSSARLATLRAYPSDLPLGFDRQYYQQLCIQHAGSADRYRQAKTVPEFPHAGGRTKQRAMFDCIRDLAAVNHGLNPTVRISEFEVEGITSNSREARERIASLLHQRGITNHGSALRAP